MYFLGNKQYIIKNIGPNPTEEDSEVGATGHDDSRTIYLLYENVLFRTECTEEKLRPEYDGEEIWIV